MFKYETRLVFMDVSYPFLVDNFIVLLFIADKTVGCDFKWDLSQGCILKTPERTNFEWNIMSVSNSLYMKHICA